MLNTLANTTLTNGEQRPARRHVNQKYLLLQLGSVDDRADVLAVQGGGDAVGVAAVDDLE